MHEYGIARELVRHVMLHLEDSPCCRVMEVRLRRCRSVAEGPLRQAFGLVSAGTPLEGARLVFEEFSAELTCDCCRQRRRIGAADIVDQIHVCPDCGATRHVDEAEQLVLLGVTLEESPPA